VALQRVHRGGKVAADFRIDEIAGGAHRPEHRAEQKPEQRADEQLLHDQQRPQNLGRIVIRGVRRYSACDGVNDDRKTDEETVANQ